MNKTDYIFFFIQDANFGFSSILIPLEKFKQIRNGDLELLNKSHNKCTLKYLNKYDINKLILIKYIAHKTYAELEDTGFNIQMSKICNDLLWYANHLNNPIDNPDNIMILKLEDALWWNESFNDIKENENEYINVVDCFIVLDSTDNTYKIPTYLDCLKHNC